MKHTVKQLASKAQTQAKQIIIAIKKQNDAESSLDWRIKSYNGLKADLIEAESDLQEVLDRMTEAQANLTKPFERYTSSRGKYGNKYAQKVYDCQRYESNKRDQIARIQADMRTPFEDYIKESMADLESAQYQVNTLRGLMTNILESLSKLTGKTYDLDTITLAEIDALAPKVVKETAEVITIPARKTEFGFRVQAANLAKIAGELFAFKGMRFYAKQISAWAKLEIGNILEIQYIDSAGVIKLSSPTSRATFKSQGDWQPCPALVFNTDI